MAKRARFVTILRIGPEPPDPEKIRFATIVTIVLCLLPLMILAYWAALGANPTLIAVLIGAIAVLGGTGFLGWMEYLKSKGKEPPSKEDV